MNYYYTKDQMLKVFEAWGVTEPLPKKGRKVLVAFPPGREIRMATVTVHDRKSTYGKTLFRVETAA